MAFVIADRVRETTTTIGTGSITLAGAYTSFQSFSAAIGNGNNTYYTIASASSGEWEVGIGTYSSGGNLLSRDTVLSSSNAGNLVNFSVGSKDVFVTQPASRAIFVQNAGTGLQTGTTAFTANRVLYANATSTTTTSANLTFDGTTLTAANFADSSLTSGRVTYATTSGNLTDSANLTFDGTTLTANALTTTSTVTINGGTANGVAYLNGSKVLTTGSALTFDGTRLGVGTASPGAKLTVSDASTGALIRVSSDTNGSNRGFEWHNSPTANIFGSIVSNYTNGILTYDSGGSVYAGSQAWSLGTGGEQMRLTSTGLGIGTSSPGVKLDVVGLARITAAQNLILNGATGTYSTVQYNGTSIGDIGTGNQVYSGGGTTDLAIAARPGYRLVLGSNGAQNAILDTSGNLGLGVTPSAWVSATGFDFSAVASLEGSSTQSIISANQYNANGTRIYKTTAAATFYRQTTGQHQWFNAASGTAGNAITFTQAMTLDDVGRLNIGGTASPSAYRLAITGDSASYMGGIIFRQSSTDTLYLGNIAANNTTDFEMWNPRNGYIRFATNNTERARITSGGDFVINGTSANAKLDVISSATGSPTMRANFNGAVTYQNPHLLLQNQNQANGDKAVIAAAFRTSGGSGYTPVAFGGIQTDNSNRYGAFVVYVSSSDNVDLSTQERMRLDSSGNLGLGVTPSAWGSSGSLDGKNDFTWSSYDGSIGSNYYYNGSYKYKSSGVAVSKYAPYNGTHIWYTAPSGTAGNAITFTQAMTLTSGGDLLVGTTTSSGDRIYVSGYVRATSGFKLDGSTYIDAPASETMRFVTFGTERARITSGGYFKASNAGTYLSSTGDYHELRSSNDNYLLYAINTRNSGGGPFGISVEYSAQDPNGTGNEFLQCVGISTLRAEIRSNGGLANYSANNVNLSDRREKTNFAPAKSYLDTICAIPVQTFNYIDQSEDDPGLTLGVVAQDVQAVAPELVMESNWGTEDNPKMRLSIYQTDLQYALMKALQELKSELDSVKAELATLKGA